MKNKSLRNIFALALILFSVFGCSKYEEGPCISFRSPESRLCGSKWGIVSVTKNNIDITNEVKVVFNYRLEFRAHSDKNLGLQSEMIIWNCCENIGAGTGSWSFSSSDLDGSEYNDTKMSFRYLNYSSDSISYYPFVKNMFVEYQIIRLSAKDLWLQHTDSIQNVYVIKFESN